jgi:hypothetical protein
MRPDHEIWPDPSARPPAADRAAIRRIASMLTTDEVERHGVAGLGWYARYYAAEQVHIQRTREAESREAKERTELLASNRDLVRRVARLEKLAGADQKQDHVLALLKIAKALGQRIEALEQRPADASVTLPSTNDIAAATRLGPPVHDAGVWTDATWYSPGDLVTHGGASWVAKAMSRGVRPGEAPASWRLVHKTEAAHVRRAVREELALQQKRLVVR